jgi:hypothetical protein
MFFLARTASELQWNQKSSRARQIEHHSDQTYRKIVLISRVRLAEGCWVFFTDDMHLRGTRIPIHCH